MSSERLRTLVEVGLVVALSAVLGLLKVTLPWNIAGGSVSLSMLPIFVIAVRRGVLPGVWAGVLYGFVDYLIEPWFIHPAQVVLDYPLAFGACGLAGVMRLVRPPVFTGVALQGFRALMAALVGGLGRFLASFASGMIFFGSNAGPGQPVWLYSLLYNASYLLPSIAVCALAAAIILPALEKAVPVGTPQGAG